MNFPPGEYSTLIVGDQWVFDQDLMVLSDGKANRGNITSAYSNFEDVLRNLQLGPLGDQRGHTADDLRETFRQGEEHARQIARKNGVKENAYNAAYNSMVSLQHDLTNLANEGNQRIKEIQESQIPVEAKVTQIVAAVNQYRIMANMVAAKYSGNVCDAMQQILDADAPGQSARQFAQAHGVDVGNMFRPPDDEENLKGQVRRMLGDTASSPALPQQGAIPTADRPGPGPGPAAFDNQGAMPHAHPTAVNPESSVPHSQPAAFGMQGRIPQQRILLGSRQRLPSPQRHRHPRPYCRALVFPQ